VGVLPSASHCGRPQVTAHPAFRATFSDVAGPNWPTAEQLPLVYHERYNVGGQCVYLSKHAV
jgi:hypothetical protein